MHAPHMRSVLIGEHLEILGVADFVACIDIDPVSETGPTSGLKFPRLPESDFNIFGALRSMMRLFCIYSIFYTTLLATGRSSDQLRLGAYLATATAIGVAGGVMFGAAGVGIGVGLATCLRRHGMFAWRVLSGGSARRISSRPLWRRWRARFLCWSCL